MRLGGWQRIGIVLSVGFMIGSLWHRGEEQNRLESFAIQSALEARGSCIARARASVPLPPPGFILDAEIQCVNEYDARVREIHSIWKPVSMDWLYNQIIIILSLWIVAYLLIFLFRWIRRGFEPR
jgi:hypothetical protein